MFWQASDDSFRRRMSWYDCIQQAFYCTKNVQIRSFSWSVFSRIWTEYGDLRSILRIQSKYGKIPTRKNSVFVHFSRSVFYQRLAKDTWYKHTFPSAYRTAALKKQYQEKHLVCSSNISGIAHVFIKKNSTSRIYKGIFPLSFRKHI